MNAITPTGLIGKKVKLFPEDAVKKEAILLSMDQFGMVFEITSINHGAYTKPTVKVGDKLFYSASTPVSLILID